jgi:hypothetical protein
MLCSIVLLKLVLLLYVSRIRSFGLFLFRIQFWKLWIHLDILDGGWPHHKVSTYTGQHNTEKRGPYIHASSCTRSHDSIIRVIQDVCIFGIKYFESLKRFSGFYIWPH